MKWSVRKGKISLVPECGKVQRTENGWPSDPIDLSIMKTAEGIRQR